MYRKFYAAYFTLISFKILNIYIYFFFAYIYNNKVKGIMGGRVINLTLVKQF